MTSKNKYDFTVFTSVFNRKNTLYRVWDSLNKQTHKNFEWIVIEDGSTDGVETLLERYRNEAKFPIHIVYQENQGKHISWNTAIKLANGEFFLPADSDDSFVPETLEKFLSFWDRIPNTNKAKFSGINVLCIDPETKNIVGNPYPKNNLISNNLELSYKYKIFGEKWGMIRVDLLRKHTFPNVLSEAGFFPENYLWFTLAKEGYKVLCINEPLRYYFSDTSNSVIKRSKKNPKKDAPTKYLFTIWHLNNNLNYLLKLSKFKKIVEYYFYLTINGLLANKRVFEILINLKGFMQRSLFILFLPFAYNYYLISYKHFKIKNKSFCKLLSC